ncbi:MAG: acetolactate decarboxylase [Desulfuromonadales bacterium]
MMKKILILLSILAVVGINPALSAERDTLVQVSTIDALLGGLYDGVATVGSLKVRGDFGIGTFDALDGEMVILGGKVYRVRDDGEAVIVPDEETTPFAAVTFFAPDREISIPQGTDLETFPALVDPPANLFHAFLVEGRFATVRTRSVPEQQKPYRPLIEVVKNQPTFEFNNVEGTLVGFYCPPFVKGINVPGYHLHFLTRERTAGGHVLDFKVDEAQLSIDTLQRFVLHLPDSREFGTADLSKERKHELEKVEK